MSSLQSLPNKPGYGNLVTIKIGKHRWLVLNDWETPYATVPAGFITDGATIPRWLWWFSHPAAEFFEASVLHDYLYKNAIKTKSFADNAFYEVSVEHHASPLKTRIAKQFVVWFGKGSY